MTTDDTELADLLARHGSARRPDRPPVHSSDADDATVAAVGKLSAAIETAEVARGHLYAFHRTSGTVDRELQEAVQALHDAGHEQLAASLAQLLVGRDIVADMWSFEIVERYDAQYWTVLRDALAVTQRTLGVDAPHVFEAELKREDQA